MSGKVTAADWAAIVTAYQRGEKSVLELAGDYGVSHQAISKGLRDRGVSRSSKLSETVDTEEDEARKAHDERIAHAKKKEETYSRYNDAIAQMVMKRVIDGDQHGSLSGKNSEILVLKNAQIVIGKARREMWDILKIGDLLGEDDALPDLNVGEYTPAELEEIRAANEEHYVESQREDDSAWDDGEEG